jgi:hypothetical protein
MDDGMKQQAQRVYENMPLLTLDLLSLRRVACIVAVRIDAGPLLSLPSFGAFHALILSVSKDGYR